MTPQHQAALEAEDEVLPDCVDAFEAPAVELICDARRRRPGMGCLDLQRLTHERLEPTGCTVEGIAFGHASIVTKRGLHPAVAGALSAIAWAILEPLDQRLFRSDYSDVAILGKAVTRGRGWRAIGLAAHALNGALFGLAYDAVRRRFRGDGQRLALGMALAEHVALFPLGYFVDRYHPARGEQGIPPLLTNPRAFGQATLRHALFGVLLGRLSR